MNKYSNLQILAPLNFMHNKGIKTLKLKYLFYCQAFNYRHFYRDRGGRHE